MHFSVFLTFTCTKQLINTCIPGTYHYGPWLFFYMCLFSTFSVIVLAGLTHFTYFQWLKITARDALCTWRILVTVPLSYISHYHNLLLTWFIIRTLVNCQLHVKSPAGSRLYSLLFALISYMCVVRFWQSFSYFWLKICLQNIAPSNEM